MGLPAVKFAYGSPEEKRLLAGVFLLGAALSVGLLWLSEILAFPLLWLPLYLFGCALLLLLLPLPEEKTGPSYQRLYRAMPTLLAMIGIFMGSSYTFPEGPQLNISDRFLHCAEYLGLGVLTARMVGPGEKRSRLASILLGVGIVAVYGGLDEIHQAWVPGRSPALRDFGYDIVGGLTGVVAYAIFSRRVHLSG